MTIQMKKVWFVDGQIIEQEIPESDIYKRDWDIASCKAYAEQLRDKNRANTAEHAAEAIEYLLALAQTDQEPEWYHGLDVYGCNRFYHKTEDRTSEFNTPLYTTPPQRKPLTDEEAEGVALDVMGFAVLEKEQAETALMLIRATEVAHNIKE